MFDNRCRCTSVFGAAAAFLVAAWGLARPAQAQRSATLTVSARVIERTVVEFEALPAELLVTAADVHRGFVEGSPIHLRVRSNSRNGYKLRAIKHDPRFAAVHLSLAGADMHVADESWLMRPRLDRVELLIVQPRYWLAASAPPGRYRLPVTFAADPR